MNEDVAGGSSSTSQAVVRYNEREIYDPDKFQVLDSGVVVDPSGESHKFYQPNRYEQLSSSWTRPNLVARKMKSKLFRSPSPQRREAFLVQKPTSEQEFLDETDRAVSSVNLTATEKEMEAEQVEYPEMECAPSTSKDTQDNTVRRGNGPLERLTLQIGKKVLRFKVIDSIAPIPTFQDTSSGPFRCQLCRSMFRSHEEFQKHNKKFHTTPKEFICVMCGIGFSNKASLTVHHKIHTGTKRNICNICHKSFSRAFNLVQHMKMHQSGRHHFCEICGRCFKELDQLMDHQTTCISLMSGDFVRLDKPLRYQCNFCEKLFHHKRDKFIHERIHTGEKPYQCGYCGRGFTQSQALTIHIRIHTGERPFTCGFCTKQFKDSSSLRKHEFRFHSQVDFIDYEEEEVSKIETGIVEEEEEEEVYEEVEIWK